MKKKYEESLKEFPEKFRKEILKQFLEKSLEEFLKKSLEERGTIEFLEELEKYPKKKS